MRGCTSTFRGGSRTLKFPISPPLDGRRRLPGLTLVAAAAGTEELCVRLSTADLSWSAPVTTGIEGGGGLLPTAEGRQTVLAEHCRQKWQDKKTLIYSSQGRRHELLMGGRIQTPKRTYSPKFDFSSDFGFRKTDQPRKSIFSPQPPLSGQS